jgi:pimeloyl-ACP methyl ester carboxylesterase
MRELEVPIAGGSVFVRCTPYDSRRPTLLFIHGLGDSGFAFLEVFEDRRFRDFNLFVPDLPGYGRSLPAPSGDYSFAAQARRLCTLADEFGLGPFCVVGHSLGGDLAVLLADTDRRERITGLVNVEGNLTREDLFISARVVEAAQQADFPTWFRTEFMENLVLRTWGRRWASCQRYYASLELCDLEAFRANATEAYNHGRSLAPGEPSPAAEAFAGLSIPKVFCWGGESLADETRRFLQEASFPNRRFEDAFHWPMIDQPEEFYAFLRDFVEDVDG